MYRLKDFMCSSMWKNAHRLDDSAFDPYGDRQARWDAWNAFCEEHNQPVSVSGLPPLYYLDGSPIPTDRRTIKILSAYLDEFELAPENGAALRDWYHQQEKE